MTQGMKAFIFPLPGSGGGRDAPVGRSKGVGGAIILLRSGGRLAIDSERPVNADQLLATIEESLREHPVTKLVRDGTTISFGTTPPRIERSPYNKIDGITEGAITIVGSELTYELRHGGAMLMALVWGGGGLIVGVALYETGEASLPLAILVGLSVGVLLTGVQCVVEDTNVRGLLSACIRRARDVPSPRGTSAVR